ncbi:MAG: hypothetical protein DWQ47_06560 [Acidobacteria bacterium]|nr:MAG: hypothetical protein DWQ32_10110 [Acidobacteriota bacterium]REK02035.1 MAG: hypothetical protein DWQ38_06540 [Acidobacteriota bacterium]REK14993.1 MAG: hypothetical protein DWQ43_15800 [Acidobacteriota bacterium]REK45707.1 MAG: hypothetical protein DWQ47_06560 [Acidobacteriota bacterium]
MTFSRRFILVLLCAAIASLAVLSACQTEDLSAGSAGSPTDAYKKLYTAVKAGKPEDIKKMLSKRSIEMGKMAAAQSGKSLEEQLKNGFTQTTFSDEMPPIRDERVNDTMGAVEVYNEKGRKWEDLPFILEDGGWKLAVGDMFGGSWKSPGESRTIRERKIANTMNGNRMVPYGNQNLDPNVFNQKPIVPKPAANGNTMNTNSK